MLRIHIKNTLRGNLISIFSAFLIIICASISMSFSLFSYMQTKENTLIETYEAGTYTVDLAEKFDEHFIEKCDVLNKTFGGLKRIELIPKSQFPLVALFSGKPSEIISEGTVGNNYEDSGIIVIGRNTRSLGIEIGDFVERFNKDFEVCGVCPANEFDFIYAKGLPQNSEIDKIRLIFSTTFSVRNSGVIISEIQKQFPQSEIAEPEKLNEFEGFLFHMRMAIVISIIAAINFWFVFSFLLNKQKHSLQIFRICGMGRIQLITLLFSEVLFVSLIGILLGDIIFFIFFKGLFLTLKKWWIYGSILSSVMCFAICIFFTVPKIISFILRKLNMEDI